MYLDPGFGGMLLQIIVAIAAAGGATLFAMRRKMRSFFQKNKKTETDADASITAQDVQLQDDDDVIDMLSDDD